MLPAWATVLLSLISAAAGVVGGIVITRIRISFDREQAREQRTHDRDQQRERLENERQAEWRDRLVLAAADYSTAVEYAILGVRDVISAVADKQEVGPVIDEAKQRSHECVSRLARIKLLFGENANATKPAKELLPELELARGAAAKTDPTFAWEKLGKVYRYHAESCRSSRTSRGTRRHARGSV